MPGLCHEWIKLNKHYGPNAEVLVDTTPGGPG